MQGKIGHRVADHLMQSWRNAVGGGDDLQLKARLQIGLLKGHCVRREIHADNLAATPYNAARDRSVRRKAQRHIRHLFRVAPYLPTGGEGVVGLDVFEGNVTAELAFILYRNDDAALIVLTQGASIGRFHDEELADIASKLEFIGDEARQLDRVALAKSGNLANIPIVIRQRLEQRSGIWYGIGSGH